MSNAWNEGASPTRRSRRWVGKPAIVCAAIAVAIFFGVAGLQWLGALEPLELIAYDASVRLRARGDAPDQRIVLVGATDEDMRRHGWPLSDAVLARLLDRLALSGARVIGIDIYRDWPVAPGTDELEAVLARHPNIVGVFKFGTRPADGIEPIEMLRNTDRTGFTDVVVDPDGVVRRAPLFLDDGGRAQHSLALRLASRYLATESVEPRPGERVAEHLQLGAIEVAPFEPNDGGYVRADARGYQMLLSYRGGDLVRIPMSEVLADGFDAARMRDRLVIVGVAAQGVKDFFQTPLAAGASDDAKMFGIALHGQIASQLIGAGLDGREPTRTLAEWQEAAWLFLWVVAGVSLGFVLRSIAAFLGTVAVGAMLLWAVGTGAFLGDWWIPIVPPALGWFVAAATTTAWLTYRERAERALLMRLFSRHVSPTVAETIWRERDSFFEGGRLLPKKLTATVLFSDLKGFTSVSEKLDPGALMDWLNVYMESMARVVFEHGGVVDKYIGDAVMAVFGAPFTRNSEAEIAQDAVGAVTCALAMGKELDRLNAAWRGEGLPDVAMRVGIFTGSLVAGSLGGAHRMEYTVLGDTVNTAARLESFDKAVLAPEAMAACRILIGASTMRLLGGRFPLRSLGAASLKGKDESIEVFLVLGSEIRSTDRAVKETQA